MSGGEGPEEPLEQLRRELSREASRVKELRAEAWNRGIEASLNREAREELLTSASWRLTRPLRAVAGLARRTRGKNAPAITFPKSIRPGRP